MSQQLIDAHRDELDAILAFLAAELATQWPRFTAGAAAASIQAALVDLSVDIVERYGEMAAGAGADWYEEMRAEANVRGQFTVAPVVSVNHDQIVGNVGYALGPLLGATVDDAAALSRLDGALQRLVLDAERETVLAAVEGDPARPRWYRYASATACAFCAMLSSRGASYRNEASASTVVGRDNYGTVAFRSGDIRYGGQNTKGKRKGQDRRRGTQGYGEKYHDHCRCIPTPLWPGQQMAPHVHGFMDEYLDARTAARKSGKPLSTEAILAEMRRTTGRK